MEDVEFEENQVARPFNINRNPKASGLTNLFFKLGLAENQKQANNLMIAISVISLLLMAYFIISTFYPGLLNFNKSKSTTLPTALQQQNQQANNQ